MNRVQLYGDLRACAICGTPMIYTRRVTRSTYRCPHSADATHRHVRNQQRAKRQIEEIERMIGGQT